MVARQWRLAVLCQAWSLLSVPGVPVAQPAGQYAVTHFTDENGLPQNSVNAIAKDPQGFLWLGTEGGLVRFDGQSFYTYDKSTLNNREGRIRFFLPRTGKPGVDEPAFYTCDGMHTYAGVYKDSYVRVVKDYPWSKVRDSLFDKMGSVNVNYVLSAPNEFGALNVDTLKSPDLGFLAADDNRYYLKHNGNIAYYIGGKQQFRVYFPRNRELLLTGGQLFAAPGGSELLRIDKNGGHPVALTGDVLNDPQYQLKKDKSIYFWNNVSRQLFLYVSGNLYEVKWSGREKVATVLLIKDMDLVKHGVVTIYMDEYRNLFLGCRTEGLYMFRKKGFYTATVPDDSVGSVFYSLVPYRDNSVLVRQGYLFDLAKGVPHAGQLKTRLGHQWSWRYLAKDKRDNLWVAESVSPVKRRLAKFSPDGKQLLDYREVEGAVDAIYCDSFGWTWFMNNLGNLYRVASEDSSHRSPIMYAETKIASLNVMYRSSDDRLWLGSLGGLHVLNVRTRALTPVRELAGKNVRHIHGSGNEFWIGTYGDGMYLYRNGKLTHFPLDEDKYLAYAHCIVPDSRGHFWIPTNKGLFEASRADLLDYAAGKTQQVFYQYYDRSGGFNTNEFNGGCQPCGIRLQSGNIALPSLNGIVYYNPLKLSYEFPDKTVLIKDVIADGQRLRLQKTITVKRDFRQLQVLLSTPYWGNKKNVLLSYSLSGEESQLWTPIADGERIYLTGLLPGKHILRIRKINGFGSGNIMYREMEIMVPPYWYETNWFAAIVFGCSIVLIYFFFRARTKFLQRQSYNENLLNNARLYGDIITSINHDIQTPMHYVIYAVEQITTHLAAQEHSNRTFSRMGTEALASLRRISTLTNNLLHYLKVNLYQNNHSIATTSVQLRSLVSEIVEMFSAKIARDHIEVINRIPEEAEYAVNPQVFSVILHNLIDNAVKVSKNGSITITVDEQPARPRLVIDDSGTGMPNDIAEWLMDTSEELVFAKTENVDRRISHTGGLGLVIVKDLCRLSGISLRVRPGTNGGTRLSLSLVPTASTTQNIND